MERLIGRCRRRERRVVSHCENMQYAGNGNVALIAAVLGVGGTAGAAAGIARILFVVFLAVWFVVSFVVGELPSWPAIV